MLHILICILILLKFSYTYASEDLEIQKTFNNIAKYIQVDKKYKKHNILEKKCNKFNIKVLQNTGKNFSISSTLKKAQRSFESGDKEAAILFLNSIIIKFLTIKTL